jgi:GAF domain-containing protein
MSGDGATVAENYERDLGAARTMQRIGEIVRTAARRLTSADGVTFVLRDGELCFYADEDAIGPLWKGQRFPMTECISGWAMLNDESVVVPDIEKDPRIPLEAYRPTFVRSMVMVPITADEPIGAIGAYWCWTSPDSAQAIQALRQLAAATAPAIVRIGIANAAWAPSFRVPGGTVRPTLHFE